jgi:hypothetical protein
LLSRWTGGGDSDIKSVTINCTEVVKGRVQERGGGCLSLVITDVR